MGHFIHGGKSYFSPSPMRAVQVPKTITDRDMNTLPFKNGIKWPELQNPVWWTRAYGWACFIPLKPLLTFYPFDRLLIVPPARINHTTNMYSLPSETIESWDRLTFRLQDMVQLLCATYHLPAVAPYTPRGWNYFREYRSPRKVRALAYASRDWFMVWSGLVAFIVHFISRLDTQPDPITVDSKSAQPPHWKALLRRAGYSEEWLMGMERVAFANVERAGLFFDHIAGPSTIDPTLPTLSWFHERGVPVWYEWNENVTGLSQADRDLYWDILPPLDPCKPAEGLITPAPSFEDNLPSDDETCGRGPCDGGEWWTSESMIAARHEFMLARLKEIEAMSLSRQGKETLQEMQVRLQRERDPPVVSAPVYVWVVDDNDCRKLVRQVVTRRERMETLENHRGSQKRYFSALNVWHCCEDLDPGEWDEGESDWDEGESDGDEHIIGSKSTDFMVEEPLLSNRVVTPPPAEGQSFIATDYTTPEFTYTSSTSASTKQDLLFESILRALSRYYGFVPPLPCPTPDQCRQWTEPERESAIFTRVLGFPFSEPGLKEFLCTEIAHILYSFYQTFSKRHVNPAANIHPHFDLSPLCPAPLATNPRIRDIVVITRGSQDDEAQEAFYVFKYPGPFQVAVKDAATALAICRWGITDPEALCLKLLSTGIAFHTFKNLPSLPRSAPEAEILYTLPERPPNYIFTKDDYEKYLHMFQNLLRNPRMRAALLRGGILWRLAWPFVSDIDILAGPTASANLVVTHPHDTTYFIDDELSHTEMALLLGTYRCFTGRGDQVALKSWWPHVHTYEGSGENYGRWTQFRENDYKKRLEAISQGKAQPLSVAMWRDKLRGRPELKTWKAVLEEESKRFINSL